jgi:hypothetical protein
MLRRACRLSMEFATAKKRHDIGRLLEAYRGAVNFYVRSLWRNPGALDKQTRARLPAERTRLQSMQKDQMIPLWRPADRRRTRPPAIRNMNRC